MRLKLLFLLISLLAESSFPIGRIGNNNRMSDAHDKYSAQIPRLFHSISSVDDGGVILASGRFTSNSMLPIDLQMLPFRQQYPQLADSSTETIADYFLATKNVQYRKIEVKNVGLTLFGETSTSYIGLSVCSDGRGYVLFGPRVELTRQGILEILTKTEFEAPCLK